MELLVLLALALGLVLALHVSARNANLLALIRVAEGKAELVRGRLPPRLWFDLEDVVQRNRTPSGEIRLVATGGQARVEASRLSEDAVQQIRNAVGQYSLPQLRRGTKLPERPAAAQNK